jgi:hypothetical protein
MVVRSETATDGDGGKLTTENHWPNNPRHFIASMRTMPCVSGSEVFTRGESVSAVGIEWHSSFEAMSGFFAAQHDPAMLALRFEQQQTPCARVLSVQPQRATASPVVGRLFDLDGSRISIPLATHK